MAGRVPLSANPSNIDGLFLALTELWATEYSLDALGPLVIGVWVHEVG